MNIFVRLFQARMWREYGTIKNEWALLFMHTDKKECFRRAKIYLYLGKRMARNNGKPKLP